MKKEKINSKNKKLVIAKNVTAGTVSKIETFKNDLVIYQGKDGSFELKKDIKKETLWATQAQIAHIFNVERSVITKHIKNIFKDSELDKKVVCAKFAHTTQHGAIQGKTQTNIVEFYNLDIILAIGYRTNSKIAIEFRKWATKVLKNYITNGFAINKKVIKNNLDLFLKDIKSLLPKNGLLSGDEILEITSAFSEVWLNLDEYDKDDFKIKKVTRKSVALTADELEKEIQKLKVSLIKKGEASEIFAVDRNKKSLEGIIGNVFQSFAGKNIYDSIEEKAAHLLYFIVKNHPFIDGNKRSGAFSFIFFLNKYKKLNIKNINPSALTLITLLVAESDPKIKNKMIKLIMKII